MNSTGLAVRLDLCLHADALSTYTLTEFCQQKLLTSTTVLSFLPEMHRSPGSVLMKRALALASSSILPLAVGQRIMCPQCIECVQCGGVKCSATSSLPPVPSQPTQDSFYRRTLPVGLVDFSSPKGKKYFADAFTAGTAESFFPLVSQYQTQSHPALCGLTTLTIMLNALKIDPARVWMHPWRWFAESLLDCCLDLDSAKTAGVTMDQLAQTGRCNRADIRVIRNITEEEARTLILSGVQQQTPGSDMFVAVSYSRQALNQTGDGHYSPVAAFDEKSDSVLILDTARFKVRTVTPITPKFSY